MMSITLIQCISPTILLLSLVIPVVLGYRRKSKLFSVALGWVLFILAFLFQDAFSLWIAYYFHGREAISAVATDQPGTGAAAFIGWFPALVATLVGVGLRRAVARMTRSKDSTLPSRD